MTPPRTRTLTRARIEIIPLIDVIFFLLATFVLFTLSLNRISSIPMTLPGTVDPFSPRGPAPLIISVSSGDALAWDGAPIDANDLASRLAYYRENTLDPRVMVAGDIHASYGAAVRVLDEARAAGIAKVSIETRVRPPSR